MILARAAHADLDAIEALENEGFEAARWGRAGWAGELDADDRLVVVARQVADDAVVGVATFSIACETADLLRVIVRADRRGRGIARRLIGAGTEWAAALGADRLLLEVEEGNAPARRLYAGLGFEPLARRKDYYGEGLDALVLALDLGAGEGREIA